MVTASVFLRLNQNPYLHEKKKFFRCVFRAGSESIIYDKQR